MSGALLCGGGVSSCSAGWAEVCLTTALLMWGSRRFAVVSECDRAIAEAGLANESAAAACWRVALPRTLVGFTHAA